MENNGRQNCNGGGLFAAQNKKPKIKSRMKGKILGRMSFFYSRRNGQYFPPPKIKKKRNDENGGGNYWADFSFQEFYSRGYFIWPSLLFTAAKDEQRRIILARSFFFLFSFLGPK